MKSSSETAWRRRGLVLPAPVDVDWAISHAALPVVVRRADGTARLFFAARDEEQRSRIGAADLDAGFRVRSVDPAPALDLGPIGAFDDHGVTPSCVVEAPDGRWFHYYTGWTKGVTVPFYFYIGLAVGRTLEEPPVRISPAPVIERSAVDPFLTASPWVMREGGRWRMWYVSGVRWEDTPRGPRHYYHIKYAESADGIRWERAGRVCVDFRAAGEHAIARPTVLKTDDLYQMWYCCRGDLYRLGYAESRDGLEWTRLDERAGLDPAPEGWDSGMIAYPCVGRDGDRLWMFYNGSGYGVTGIGLADRPAFDSA